MANQQVHVETLMESNIPEGYWGATLKKYRGPKKIITAVSSYMLALQKGTAGSLYFCGPTPSGKTHLAMVIAKYALVTLHKRVLVEDLTGLVDATFDRVSDSDPTRYRDADVLILDPFERANTNEMTRSVVFDLLEYRSKWKRPVIYTSTIPLTGEDGLAGMMGDRVYRMVKRTAFVIECPRLKGE